MNTLAEQHAMWESLIMPKDEGGTNADSNMQLLRARCNLQKNRKHPVDFMQERGFLL